MLLLQWPPTCTHQATHAEEKCKQHRQHFQLNNASEIKNWSGKLILLAFMLGTGRLAGAGDNHSGMALGHHLSILYLLRCCRGAHFCFLQNLQRKRHLCFLRISLDNFCPDARRICWCHNSKQQQTTEPLSFMARQWIHLQVLLSWNATLCVGTARGTLCFLVRYAQELTPWPRSPRDLRRQI